MKKNREPTEKVGNKRRDKARRSSGTSTFFLSLSGGGAPLLYIRVSSRLNCEDPAARAIRNRFFTSSVAYKRLAGGNALTKPTVFSGPVPRPISLLIVDVALMLDLIVVFVYVGVREISCPIILRLE